MSVERLDADWSASSARAYPLDEPPLDVALRDPWFRALLSEVPRDSRVLDLGCGGGLLTSALGARGNFVVGADASRRLLRLARERAGRWGEVALVCADATALPFRNAAFDVACGSFVLHHVGVARAVPELTRVLAYGGALVFLETYAHPLFAPLLAGPLRALVAPRTRGERPLTARDLALLRRLGRLRALRPSFALFERFFEKRSPRLAALARRFDDAAHRVRALRPLSYYVVLALRLMPLAV